MFKSEAFWDYGFLVSTFESTSTSTSRYSYSYLMRIISIEKNISEFVYSGPIPCRRGDLLTRVAAAIYKALGFLVPGG